MRSPSEIKFNALIATFFNNIKQSSVWALVQIELAIICVGTRTD